MLYSGSGHWGGFQFGPQVILGAVDRFRRLNAILPQWLIEPQLRAPTKDD